MKFAALLLTLLLPGLAFAQSAPVYQMGTALQNDLAKYQRNGQIRDAGTIAGDNNGAGVNPFAATDYGQLGICSNSALTTGPYSQVCIGHDSVGNGVITFDSLAGAPPRALKLIINGVATVLPQATAAPPNVLTWGAVCDGVTDDAPAFNTALTDNKGGIVAVPPRRCRLLSSVSIPANTTLRCEAGFADNQDDDRVRFGTAPALMLASTASIQASGQSASLIGCGIQRDGMTFPAPNSTSYAGVAVKDATWENFALTDTVIVGFATCVWIQGSRPYLRRVYVDCAGDSGVGTNGAAIEIDNGNHDSGYLHDIKLQPIATGNGHCTNSTRPGHGISLSGINYVSNITSLNFRKAQVIISGGTLVSAGGTIWADYVWEDSTHVLCDLGSTVGVQMNGGLIATTVNLNGTKTGIVMDFANSDSWIGQLFLNRTGGDCVVARQGGLHIDSIQSNQLGTENCVGYAVELTADASSWVSIGSAKLNGIHGNVAPYFHSSFAGLPQDTHVLGYGGTLWISNLRTNLAFGTSPYNSAWAAGNGSDEMTGSIAPAMGTCTGLGTGGTCTLQPLSTSKRGVIRLVAGTGAAASGNIQLVFPVKVATVRSCTFVAIASGNWLAPVTFQISQVSTTTTMTVFTNSAALTNTVAYDISYQCSNG